MTTDLGGRQPPFSPAEQPASAEYQRLRAAALLTGLTESEAQSLLGALAAGEIQVTPGATPEDYRVTPASGEAHSLLVWAAAHSAPDAIVLAFDAVHWRAYFADQRAHEEVFVGVAHGYVAAVDALLTIAGARERLGISSDADPQQAYGQLAERGMIAYAPNPYTLLGLQDAWNSRSEQ
jgi:hypothetical protein